MLLYSLSPRYGLRTMPGHIIMISNKEAIIFIDGNNLYHNLKQMNLKPKVL